MLSKLSGAQRIWLLFGVVFLASALAVTAAAWPKRDAAVVADLAAAECSAWLGQRDIHRGGSPTPSQPCYALRSFLLDKGISLASPADYDSYRFRTGVKNGLTFLGIWAAFMAVTYALGWSTARVTARFAQRRTQAPR